MRKRTKLSRILTLVLTFSLVFQQAGITTFADDGLNEAAVSAVADLNEDGSAEAAVSQDETTAAVTETQETSAPATEATAETSAPAAEAATETSASEADDGGQKTPDTSAAEEGTTEAEAETQAVTEGETEAAAEALAEAMTEIESETETEVESESEAETETETETETEDPLYAEAQTYLYSDEDVTIQVTVPEEAKLPYGTELDVTAVQDNSDEYERLSALIEAADTSIEVVSLMAYDMSFVLEGEAVTPEAGTLSIGMDFVEAVLASADSTYGESIRVFRIADGEAVEFTADTDLQKAEEGGVTGADFTDSALAAYAIVRTAEKRTVKTYTYEDSKISVTATLQYAEAIPDDAEFRVTPITASTSGYNYDAYMQALNDNAETILATDASIATVSGEEIYTSDNTLLYDVAFIVPKTDENGDVIEGEEVEYQPEKGSVKITFKFKKDQLSDTLEATEEEGITVVHLPLDSDVKESVDTTADATDISASDVNIEVVDANVSISNTEQVSFSLNDLSCIVISKDNPITVGSTHAYTDILGNAIYFGIVTEYLELKGHMDTNFATQLLAGNMSITAGKYTGSNSSTNNGGVYVISAMTSGSTLSIDGASNIEVWTTPDAESAITLSSGGTKISSYTQATLDAYVQALLDSAEAMSHTLLSETEYAFTTTDQNETIIDLSELGAGTYYIDGESLAAIANGGLKIKKKSTQTVVFNYSDYYNEQNPLELKAFKVWDVDTGATDYISSSSSDNSVDEYARTIVFNMPNAEYVKIVAGVVGILLAPNATVSIGSTSSGWLIAKNVENPAGEWHNVWSDMPTASAIPAPATLVASKTVDSSAPTASDETFKFELYKWEASSSTWSYVEEVENKGSAVSFSSLTLSDAGDYYYKISEVVGSGDYTYDTTQYIAKVTVSSSKDNNNITTYTIDSITYYTADDASIANPTTVSPAATAANGATFNNTRKQTASLTVSKTVVDDSKTPETGKTFTFELHVDNITGTYPATYSNGTTTTVKFEGGMATVKLTGGQSITINDLPVNESYSVEEAAETGYTVTVSQDGTSKGNIRVVSGTTTSAGSTVAFTNTRDVGSLTLTKNTVVPTGSGISTPDTTTFTVKNSSGTTVATVTYAQIKAEGGSYKISNLPVGTYTVTESGEDVSGYNVEVTGNATVTITATDSDKTVELTNTYTKETGGLKVIKTVTGATTPANTVFKVYKVETDGSRTLVASRTYSEFAAAGFFTLTNLTAGNYIVYEEGAEVAGYTLKVTGANQTVAVAENKTSEITIVNEYTQNVGSLTLVKTTTGNTTPSTTVFTIKSADGQVEKSVTYADFTNGSYTFTNLPAGTYTVTESGAEIAGYSLTVTADSSAAVSKGSETTYSITNTYNEHIGGLLVTKKSIGADTPDDAVFTVYKIEDSGAETLIATKKYSDFKVLGYFELDNLALGKYVVRESGAEIDGYTLIVAADHRATIETLYETAEVVITNEYTQNFGSLKVTKTTTGNTTPDSTVFTVENSAGEVVATKTYDLFKDQGYFVLTGLPADTYTVTESNGEIADYVWTCVVDYGTDGNGNALTSAAVTKDGTAEVTITNTYSISEDASVAVTKKLTYQGDEIGTAAATFYAGLYLDAACTNLYAMKVLTYSSVYASSATVTFENLEIGKTYYIAECDVNGTALTNGVGTLADGTIFAANFGDGATTSSVTVTEGGQTTVTFENEFYTMPSGFYKEGTLTITKKLLGADGAALASGETFYAGIFSDSSYTTLATNVEQNIVALSLAGGSEVSVEVGVSIGSGETVTLYVTETDADGNPVANAESFAYTVSVDSTKVALDETNSTASVTITNQEIEETEETEEESEEVETESETEAAVQTGDETPIMPYMLAMLAALIVLLAGVLERKRRNAR